MKITKTASGKKKIKISRKEWEDLGKKAGWIKKESREITLCPICRGNEIEEDFQDKTALNCLNCAAHWQIGSENMAHFQHEETGELLYGEQAKAYLRENPI